MFPTYSTDGVYDTRIINQENMNSCFPMIAKVVNSSHYRAFDRNKGKPFLLVSDSGLIDFLYIPVYIKGKGPQNSFTNIYMSSSPPSRGRALNTS